TPDFPEVAAPVAATDHQVDSAICGALLCCGEETASWPQTFETALNNLGKREGG
ncbi:Hypothetical predicted protein, partial [Marmota monax]